MAICWGVFSTKSRKALKTGWLIAAGAVALAVQKKYFELRATFLELWKFQSNAWGGHL